MTTITITKGAKKDIDLLLDLAKRLGIEMAVVSKEEKADEKMSRSEFVDQLTKKSKKNMTKRLLAQHNISYPDDSNNGC